MILWPKLISSRNPIMARIVKKAIALLLDRFVFQLVRPSNAEPSSNPVDKFSSRWSSCDINLIKPGASAVPMKQLISKNKDV